MNERRPKPPQYSVEGLKQNLVIIDRNIARITEEVEKARRYIEAARQAIARNEKDIQIFNAEIERLKQEKIQIQALIAQLEKGG